MGGREAATGNSGMRIFRWSSIRIVILAAAACIAPAAGATETVLYSFTDASLGNPTGRLTFRSGSLFGTGSGLYGGDGQVFELVKAGDSWKFKTLVTFTGANGASPRAGLIEDSTGALYGTTAAGGRFGNGNVFKLWKSGGVWISGTVYDFGGKERDGAAPECDLIIGSSGALYGTTYSGGINQQGTVFRLTQSGGVWKERVLYRFTRGFDDDGFEPVAGLLLDKRGTLFGTTYRGGPLDYGTVFKLTRSGGVRIERVIHTFTGGSDGSYAVAGLIGGSRGTLYGTTSGGGQFNSGTAFELSRSGGVWTHTVIDDFGAGSRGSYPQAGLLRAGNGTLYGTTESGGPHGSGTLFALTKSGDTWTETVLHDFGGFGDGDGANPVSAPVVDKNGNLYGTTLLGGAYGNGAVYEVTP